VAAVVVGLVFRSILAVIVVNIVVRAVDTIVVIDVFRPVVIRSVVAGCLVGIVGALAAVFASV
jgi:hypothetical protein